MYLDLEKINGKSSEFLNKEKLYECFCELKNTPAGLDPILHDTVRYGIGIILDKNIQLLLFNIFF